MDLYQLSVVVSYCLLSEGLFKGKVYSDSTLQRQFNDVKHDALVLKHMLINRTFTPVADHYNFYTIGRLIFHYDIEYENDNEISLSFSLRFCSQRNNDSSLPFRRLLQR